MSYPAVREGDMSLGACGYPPIPATSSIAMGVYINGRRPMIVGSIWGNHCRDDCHFERCVQGDPTVLVNDKPIVCLGDVLSNGDIAGTGSLNVYA